MLLILSYLPNPSARAGCDTRSIFKRSLTGLNSEFSFSKTSCLAKAKELSLSYYFPIAGGRTIGFIPFPRVLVLCEMQSVRSRICPLPKTITITPRWYWFYALLRGHNNLASRLSRNQYKKRQTFFMRRILKVFKRQLTIAPHSTRIWHMKIQKEFHTGGIE